MNDYWVLKNCTVSDAQYTTQAVDATIFKNVTLLIQMQAFIQNDKQCMWIGLSNNTHLKQIWHMSPFFFLSFFLFLNTKMQHFSNRFLDIQFSRAHFQNINLIAQTIYSYMKRNWEFHREGTNLYKQYNLLCNLDLVL